MAPPTPQVDAAVQLIADLAACLEVNDVPVPAFRGVSYCTECIIAGCCNHLVAIVQPQYDLPRNCIVDAWEIPVLYGRCYNPCASTAIEGAGGVQPEVWLTEQVAFARTMEQAFFVMTEACQCNCTVIEAVTPFCNGGCGGFRVTYRLDLRT